jgi:TraY domain
MAETSMPRLKMVRRGRGRPTVGKRMSLGLRVTPEMKRKLDVAAEKSGRSQSQEAELRLERSFDRNDLLGEVLSLAFGERLAGLLILTGLAMASAAAIAPVGQGQRELRRDDDWLSDPAAYGAAVFAASRLLDSARPAGDGATTSGYDSACRIVEALIDALNGKNAESVLGRGIRVDAIIRLIGPIATRMNQSEMRDGRTARNVATTTSAMGAIANTTGAIGANANTMSSSTTSTTSRDRDSRSPAKHRKTS